jgi:hypothetical protein
MLHTPFGVEEAGVVGRRSRLTLPQLSPSEYNLQHLVEYIPAPGGAESRRGMNLKIPLVDSDSLICSIRYHLADR